jgi:hypothetical protein
VKGCTDREPLVSALPVLMLRSRCRHRLGAEGEGPRQKQVREYRGQLRTPGRPTVAWREDRLKFWAAIRSGVMTEDTAAAAGVSSPVGFRWFRHAGGVNPGLPATVSGRYLSFSEREGVALSRAQGMGVREIARVLGRDASTISRELRRNASSRTATADRLTSGVRLIGPRSPGRVDLPPPDKGPARIRTVTAAQIEGPGSRQSRARDFGHRELCAVDTATDVGASATSKDSEETCRDVEYGPTAPSQGWDAATVAVQL